MSLLARRVLVSDVPGDGGGAAWGHPLSSPLLRAPLPLSGQMGPHPLLPKDTESLCLRSQRLGGRHCRLLPLGRGAGGSGQFRARDMPLGFLLTESPSDPACLCLFNCTDSST